MKIRDFSHLFLFNMHNDSQFLKISRPTLAFYINKMIKTVKKDGFRYSLFTIVLYNKVEYANTRGNAPSHTKRQVFYGSKR